MSSSIAKSLIAYSQSAGYAEQAFAAIRVVVAFGMEGVELGNYSKYLIRAKNASMWNHFCNALGLGFMFMIIYCCYAYAFYAGSLFVEHQVWNSGRGRPYQGGDSIGCFFAVLIGLFSIAMISNQVKATVEAKVAAKFIFEVIDRKPPIPLDDPNAEKHILKGEIVF